MIVSQLLGFDDVTEVGAHEMCHEISTMHYHYL